MVAETDVGAEVAVLLWRDGGSVTTAVTIGRLEDYEVATRQTNRRPEIHEFASLGITLADITDDHRERFDLGAGQTGVVVTATAAGAASAEAGEDELAPGEGIVKVDRHPVGTVADVVAVLLALAPTDPEVVLVLRQRGTEQNFVALKIRDPRSQNDE